MILVFLAMVLPVNILVQMSMLHTNQQENAQEAFGQLTQLIETNQQDIARSTEEFSEKVIQSAQIAAYFVKDHPEMISNLEYSRELAKTLDVDEIHYFTPEGEIFAGTHPEYYGYTFSSGAQMSFFLPMLDDQSLALCQEITPNTAEGKEMQYAAVWMEDGSGIIQIGMEPRRLQQVINEKSLPTIISAIPLGLRGYLHIVDKNTCQIVASTKEELVGMDMSELAAQVNNTNTKTAFHCRFNGERYCVYLYDYGNYFLIRTYLSKYPLQEVVVSSVLVLLYFTVVSAAVIWGISRYIDRKLLCSLTTIVDGLKRIEDGNVENISLKTGITEYNDLIFYINQMLNSVRLGWEKLIYVIDKSQFPVGVFEYNVFYKKVFINRRLQGILGTSEERDRFPQELARLTIDKLNAIRQHPIDENEHIYRYDINGISTCLRIERVSDEQSVTYYVTDVSAWWHEFNKLKDESVLDFLTNLYNRRGFSITLDKLFIQPEKLGFGMMVIVDADNLKHFNDVYGHHMGDEYLRQIAQLLQETAGASAICARLGGDEFAVFLYGYTSVQELETRLLSLKTMRGKPFVSGEIKADETLEFSIGAAFYPSNGQDHHLLMYIADKNMYEEKSKRRLK